MKANLFVGKLVLLAAVVASGVAACATFTNPIDADPSVDAGYDARESGSVGGDAFARDSGPVDARTDSSAAGKGGSSGGSGSGGFSSTGSGGGTGSGSAVGSGGAVVGGGGSGPICGNRIVDPGEECDDGNTKDFDGCTNCLADCDKCVRQICTDPNQVGLDLIASCFEMLGTAQGGRAQGTPLADLCTAAVHCALRANCWVNDVSLCYCGDTNIVDCQNGSKPPDGACQAEFEDAAESTIGLEITVRLTDPTWAIGRAGFVLQCAGTFCGSCTNPDRVCGNGIVGGAEGCDDGNTTAGDGCSPLCQPEVCGNGVIDPGEFCDDGNTLPSDGCPSKCQSCGNGDLDSGEACDDGNELDLDGCTPKCQIDLCGNGVVDPGEGCDDGNRTSYDGCSAHCEFCGNKVVDADKGEECDDGNAQSGDGCSVHCKTQLCGNGKVEEGESCDDGNVVAGDGCSVLCAKECGDGVLDKNLEQCDDGNASDGDGCSITCRATCGDGFKVGIEECDDGNTKAGDGCGPTCLKE